ncbi:unnamed protein product [Symbiodinium sp. CCMP2592]|nr:unnamed protein product [Symbiodinium sp. CCMP2592]
MERARAPCQWGRVHASAGRLGGRAGAFSRELVSLAYFSRRAAAIAVASIRCVGGSDGHVPHVEREVKEMPRRLEKACRMQQTPVRSMAESASAPSVQARAKKPDIPDVNMDIEAVLEAQKRRIEGLKNKLNMTIA